MEDEQASQVAELVDQFEQALLAVDRLAARRIFEQAASRTEPLRCVEQLVVKSLERIGLLWERGDAALSQMYMSGRICERLVDEILPPQSPDRTDQPSMAIGVLADHHQLGKRLVYSMLRAGGFELQDLGHGLGVDEVVRRVEAEGIKILLISVLMLPSAMRVKELRAKLNEATLGVKLVVGGAPFRLDRGLWQEVGADATAPNAGEAVELISRILEG